MSDVPGNLVLAMLRRMDTKLDRGLEELHDVKVRLTAVEENLAGVHRRIDRLDERIQRIERRPELTDATH
ncbi:hypothetical protein Sa4125_19920 [Aureimonas sp. SA4125]|uniref:hypothetical protein n=1 Tax=Aureimonas sp. SA4125 TaxID=2826993 RepID=UPI001CC5E35D|nr:hypothetical protein [Aureimonas sp. SA4125]BDA84450.1 hypothetical protein Sa4125_19920 [Aureimonas sp. SA4125]